MAETSGGLAARARLRPVMAIAVASVLVVGTSSIIGLPTAAATTAPLHRSGSLVTGRPASRTGRAPKSVSRPASASIPSNCSSSGGTFTCTFSANYTGSSGPSSQSLTVPQGIGSIAVSLYGAQGGGGGNGALGGFLNATVSLSSGLTSATPLNINVGELGGYNGSQSQGGWPDGGGGGSGHNPGCGGGGGTQVSAGGSVLAEAAGGGGCGGYGAASSPSAGGYGGGANGGGGSGGGTPSNGFGCGGGGGGTGASQSGGGGGGGTSCSGPTSGGGGNANSGGGGGNGYGSGGGGGGGGGGWYGGGGGGGGTDYSDGGTAGGGGGGGSSDCSSCTNVATVPDVGAGDGSATVSWTQITTSLNLSATPTSIGVGGPVTLTATPTTPSSPSYAPTGTVSFSGPNGAIATCQNVAISSGSASCPTTASNLGTDSYSATYSGDETAAPETASTSVNAIQESTTTALVSATLNNAHTQYSLLTTVTPGDAWGAPSGTVNFDQTVTVGGVSQTGLACTQTFTGSASTTSTPYPNSVGCTDPASGAAPLIAGASYSFTATYVGDTNDSGSSSASATTYHVPRESTTATIALAGGSSSSVTFGQPVTVAASVAGVPAADTSGTGTLLYEYSDGTPVDCSGTGTAALPVTPGNGSVADCTFVPTVDQSTVEASYSGDFETDGSNSSTDGSSPGTVAVSVAPASTSASVSVTAAGGNADIGVPITVAATIANTSNSGPGPDGLVEFYEDGVAVAGCTSVAAVPTGQGTNQSVATCTSAPATTDLSPHSFYASYCPVTSAGDCADWAQSQSPTTTYTAGPDPTSITLQPTASADHPISVSAGVAVTVTATVSVTAGSATPIGLVTFLDNASAIELAGGSSCSGLPLSSSGGGPATVTCTFTPTPGTTNSVVATYNEGTDATDALTLGSSSTSTPLYYKVGGAPTSTTLSVDDPAGTSVGGGSVPYGVPLTLVASVRATGATVAEGTVDFTLANQPILVGGVAICENVAVANGVATCPTTFSPTLSSDTFGATYGDASQTYLASTSPGQSVTVTAASTSTGVAVGPDPSSSTKVMAVATVTNTATGSLAAPAGSVAFTVGTSSECSSVALVPSPGGHSSTAQCAIAAPTSGTESFGASFSPTSSAEFGGSSASPVDYPYTTTCSAVFDTLWTESLSAGTSVALHVGILGTSIDSASVTLGATSGSCSPGQVIPVTSGSISLFGQTLASSGSTLTGYVEDATTAGGSPTLCITGGTLDLPSKWDLPPIVLGSGGDKICFVVSGATGGTSPSVTLGGVSSAQLSVSGITLPFGTPDSSLSYDAALSFEATAPAGSCSSSGDQLDLTLAPAGSPGSSPYLDGAVALSISGTTVSACGQVTVGNLFIGGTVTGTFTVSAGAGGSLAGSFTLQAIDPTTPISPAPGVEIQDVVVTVSSAGGLTLTAQGSLGNGSEAVEVSLTGGYSKGTWSLALSAATNLTWSPFSSLTFSNLTLTGTISITTGGVVTFDIEAGTPPSGTSPGLPLVAWDPVSGVVVDVECIALSYGIAPACAAGAASLPTPTDPTLVVDGYVTLGTGSTSVSAGLIGTIDLRQGSANLSLDTTTTLPSIQVVSGLTVTLQSLSVSGGLSGGITVDGVATAVVPVLGATATSPLTVTVSNDSGQLVIAVSGISLASAGIPVDGFFAFATGAVPNYVTGDPAIGTVDLVDGFNAYGVYTPPAGVISALDAAGFSLTAGDTILFSATFTPGSLPTFTGALTAPSGFPFVTLPGGGSITGATISFSNSELTLSVTGTIPVPGSAAAGVSLDVMIGTDGSFSGTVVVSGLEVFGQLVGLQGSIARSSTGQVTADIASCQPQTGGGCTVGPIAGPFTPFPGVPLQLTDVSFDLGTSGLTVSGTATVSGLGSLSISGSLQSLKSWSVTITASQAQAWSPAPSVSIDAELSGTITDTNGAVTFSLSASGANGGNLFVLDTGGVTLTVSSIELGNAAPPSGCTISSAGDLWLFASGSLAISLGSASGSATAAGCFDITSKSLEITATITSLDVTSPDGHVHLNAPTVTLTEANSKYTVEATVPLSVTMPNGGSFNATVTITFESGGAFVAGIEANLSQWLGTSGDTAYIYYASQAVSGFATGDPALASIDLSQGLNFALAITLPQSVVSALGGVGINVPGGTALAAIGTADFTTGTFTLKIVVSFGTGGITVFSSGSTSLVLDNGYLKVQLGGGQVEFGVGMTATLNLPPPSSSDTSSSVQLIGELDVSDVGLTLSLSLGNCTDTSVGWVNAFGISGLTVKCAALQGGITFEGVPTVGFEGTITSLPSVISSAIGYQDGAPITFAFNLDPFLLDLSIGTKNSGTPALEPLQAFGQASLIQIDYASLYISPTGATIGQTVYPAGFGLGFQAVVAGVNINVLANIGFSPPSFNFTGTISTITIGSLSIGPVSLTIDASPSNFEFQFQGSLSLGPGTVQIGPDLQVGGSLSATVQIEISTSGISAFMWGSIAVSVATYVPTEWCYYKGVVPYPCDYQWQSSSSSFTLGKTGFSADSSGVTLEADGYSITFSFSGSVSISTASYVTRLPGATNNLSAPAGALLASYLQSLGRGGEAYLVSSRLAHKGPLVGSLGSGRAKVVSGGGTSAASGVWLSTSPMPTARALASTALLHNGEVLVAGGLGASGAPVSSAEVYDPASGRWTPAASMTTARIGASSSVLPDGDVIVAGGIGKGGSALSSAEIFDPSTGLWSAAGSMPMARAYAEAALLPGGAVLIPGGIGASRTSLSSAVEYDPRTGHWSVVASMGGVRAFAGVAALPGGDVLVVGGFGSSGPLATAERFDPTTGAWSSAGRMSSARFMVASTVLHDGDVLVVGDGPNAQLYNPATNQWSSTEQMPGPSVLASVVSLANGDALAVGGDVGGLAISSSEVFDPATNQWTSAGSMSSPRFGVSVAALPDGEVLAAGGASSTVGQGGGSASSGSRQLSSVTPVATAELYSVTGQLSSAQVSHPVPLPGVVATLHPGRAGVGVLWIALGGVLVLALGGAALFAWRRRMA